MGGHTGHGLLHRSRSHKKLRIIHPTDIIKMEEHSRFHNHTRQHSSSSSPGAMSASPPSPSRLETKGHWPPIEWDPLKLNPPVIAQGPEPPARLHERQPLRIPQARRSFGGHERTRPTQRLHHSDSGLTLPDDYRNFDFTLERAKALQSLERNRQRDVVVHDDHDKGWPSPASSVDSGKSWFEDDTEDEDEDDAVQRSHELWDDLPNPRPRPQVASPADPNYFIQRGEWKRRGIFFGGESAEAYHQEEDVFDL
ncbi:hypothetical protein BD289DRAFT_481520 [Coniella lustricola]|uniref:Uncharacterized protein n=1 Tax=Coniella lustricola TaxID=2025994 RepID=A0A2T3ABY1_9PEZI|nr:hypothetical protein BD289DRAFT_481520 [Coniella lustricola]